MTVREFLHQANKVSKSGREWLLSSLLSCSRAQLYVNNYELKAPQRKKLKIWLKKRERGEPLQYITGLAPFFGREFKVNRFVLIPRPETEILVEILLRVGDGVGGGISILDIGTGSGAIAVTAKLERPAWNVSATDISSNAIRVAKSNAAKFNANIQYKKANLLNGVKGGWDIIVSNPPYLNFKRDRVAKDVLRHEPLLALFPQKKDKTTIADQGAWLADKIIEQSINRGIRPKYILLEVSPRVATLLERKWKKNAFVESIQRESDLVGRKRFVVVALR